MKITKAKLKQIIQEELSSLGEGMDDVYGHQSTEADPRGTSMPLTMDADVVPVSGQTDPAVAAISMVEDLGNMIMDKYPDEKESLILINELWEHLKGMQTGAGNEVAMAMGR
jgi:hypothetical protein|tara:strand:- start:7 stop:342 length:336 start_codon:yes stop_codon:yes gene_type:complete